MKKTLIVFFFLFTWVVSSGCSEPAPTKQIQVGADYYVVTELPKMVEKSELVVIGKFGSYMESYNSDRDMQDPSKPSKESYSESKIYQFQISETLKGKTDSSTIRVGIPYTREITGLKDAKGNELNFKAPHSLAIKPDPQKRYILFLQNDRYIQAYLAPFYPNILEINSNNQVTIKKTSTDINQTVESKSGETYGLKVEEIHIPNDPISGKSLAEIKQTITKSKK